MELANRLQQSVDRAAWRIPRKQLSSKVPYRTDSSGTEAAASNCYAVLCCPACPHTRSVVVFSIAAQVVSLPPSAAVSDLGTSTRYKNFGPLAFQSTFLFFSRSTRRTHALPQLEPPHDTSTHHPTLNDIRFALPSRTSHITVAVLSLKIAELSKHPSSVHALGLLSLGAIMATFELPRHGDVVDIGGSAMMSDVGQRLKDLFSESRDKSTTITLPDELLYTDRGLAIWNDIIFTPEFYQTHDEIAIFDKHGDDVVSRAHDGVVLIDLGAGLVCRAKSSCSNRLTFIAVILVKSNISSLRSRGTP